MSSTACELRVASCVQDSIVDGPGLRFTLFVQGCARRCPGCHNPSTHDFGGGTLMPLSEIQARIASNPLLDGITLSGGEPFAQAAALCPLARWARLRGLNVFAYTGYAFEELLAGAAEHPEWLELLELTDVLVDGPFILAQRTLELPFRGSKNQRLLDAQRSLKARAAVEWRG